MHQSLFVSYLSVATMLKEPAQYTRRLADGVIRPMKGMTVTYGPFRPGGWNCGEVAPTFQE
jgi:hypothetical protein